MASYGLSLHTATNCIDEEGCQCLAKASWKQGFLDLSNGDEKLSGIPFAEEATELWHAAAGK
jgi:hypothetical protein